MRITMKEIRISVIMICSDNEKVDTCINQVLKQLNKNDQFVLILDSTPEFIINRIKIIKDPRFSVYKNSLNGNRSANRNLGFKMSNNEYLIFMDGDMFLQDDCIDKFREWWRNNPDICLCGNIHGMQYEYGQLAFLLQDNSVESKYNTENGRKQLLSNPAFTDFRYNQVDNIKSNNLTWMYFYSAYCGIPSKIFAESGGFDEDLLGWGAEDVDLGYRLSKLTEIIYDKSMKALHIPHKRNIFSCRDSNVLNIYRLYVKYKTQEFEFHSAYHSPFSNIPILRTILKIMQTENITTPHSLKLNNNEIYIFGASNINPNGRIAYKINNKVEEYKLTGSAIPCYDKKFKAAFLSDISLYPSQVYATILAEAIRVSERTFIKVRDTPVKINWHKYNIDLRSLVSVKFNFYKSETVADFSFIKLSEFLFEVKYQIPDNIPVFSYTIFNDKLKFNIEIIKQIHDIYSKDNEIIFINLSSLETRDCPIKAMADLLGFKPVLSYKYSPRKKPFNITETIYEDLNKYTFKFVFFVDIIDELTGIEEWRSLRDVHDLIVDRNGELKII